MAKILLVDDEPRIARVVRDMVEGADWQFAYADNGADALDAVVTPYLSGKISIFPYLILFFPPC